MRSGRLRRRRRLRRPSVRGVECTLGAPRTLRDRDRVQIERAVQHRHRRAIAGHVTDERTACSVEERHRRVLPEANAVQIVPNAPLEKLMPETFVRVREAERHDAAALHR